MDLLTVSLAWLPMGLFGLLVIITPISLISILLVVLKRLIVREELFKGLRGVLIFTTVEIILLGLSYLYIYLFFFNH